MSSKLNSGKLAKVSKKVQEVKEVVQNRPDADIIKVLEYYDNDVRKTLDAFVNGNRNDKKIF